MDPVEFENAQETVQLDGLSPASLQVAYRDLGAGTPVVLLHGIPAWSFVWSKITGPLSEACRVIAPDLIGYGSSDKRDCFDRSVRRQARMISKLLDSLKLETAIVVGHDIGGAVAQVMAVDFADRVDRLVLVNSVAYGSWPSSSMTVLGDPHLLERPEEIMETIRDDAKIGHAEGAETDAFAREMAAPYNSEEGRRSMVRNASALNTNHTMELASQLEDVNVPTLVLWGEQDPWQPLSDAERLTRDIPGAELVTVPQASHWLPYDKPDRTVRPLKRFVSDR